MELNEKIYFKKLESGIKCYVIPKKGYKEKHGLIATDFGSAYRKFKVSNKEIEIPFGTAHFLEHKLFEDEKIDITDEFSKLGANTNAFTNHTNTAYYFNTSENFSKCHKLLMEFVSEPYFTNENVENEKEIIIQEIKMYKDHPSLQVYLNMMDSMYNNKSFSENISGKEDDVQKITADDLYCCYENFYYPNNMSVICIGDIEPEEIFENTDKYLKLNENKEIEIIFEDESEGVKNNYVESKMPLSNSIFCIGFKENSKKENNLETIVSSKILMDIMFGESSDFYERMYNKGLIDNTFNGDYNNFKFFATNVLAGVCEKPKELGKFILEEIESYKQKGISEERFNLIKKKSIGRYIREFNNIENISYLQLELHTMGYDFQNMMDLYKNIDFDTVSNRLKESFIYDNHVLSVILPK